MKPVTNGRVERDRLVTEHLVRKPSEDHQRDSRAGKSGNQVSFLRLHLLPFNIRDLRREQVRMTQ